MTLTKSQASARVRAGTSVETFHHATMGLFNISLARALIKAHPKLFPPMRVKFADLKAENNAGLDAAGVVGWLIGQREVCPKRCAELTPQQLNDPVINMIDDHGMSYLIDGIHRLSERFRRGMPDYECHMMPASMVPRMQPGTYRERPWGEMDVRDGQLVRRK